MKPLAKPRVKRRNNVYPLITQLEWKMMFVVLDERIQKGDWDHDEDIKEDYEQLLTKVSMRGRCAR